MAFRSVKQRSRRRASNTFLAMQEKSLVFMELFVSFIVSAIVTRGYRIRLLFLLVSSRDFYAFHRVSDWNDTFARLLCVWSHMISFLRCCKPSEGNILRKILSNLRTQRQKNNSCNLISRLNNRKKKSRSVSYVDEILLDSTNFIRSTFLGNLILVVEYSSVIASVVKS